MDNQTPRLHQLSDDSLNLFLDLLGEKIDHGRISSNLADVLLNDLKKIDSPAPTLKAVMARLTALRDRVYDFMIVDGNGQKVRGGYLDTKTKRLSKNQLTSQIKTELSGVQGLPANFEVQLNQESPLIKSLDRSINPER